jgi:anti-sigma regulatory factor (Ser/Thr protein kinase)
VLYHHAIGNQFELRFEPSHAAASEARHAARAHLDGLPLATPVVADIELVVSELISNAVEQGPTDPIHLTLAVTAVGVMVTVTNRTTGPSLADRPDWGPAGGRHGGDLAERGWGLGIVEALTDGLWIDDVDGWTSVRCFRRLDSPSRW